MSVDQTPERTSPQDDQLAPYAMRSEDSAGREQPEPNHPYRGDFQRDRDRILHSSAFRRLSGKTQVFTEEMGDYHRTRLTHTMEVASIARTLGGYLRLNADLVEALALLHDIGHPPFGHAGEAALCQALVDDGGFSHNQFALTLVRELERPYADRIGLNLTQEVLASQQSRIDKSNVQRRPLLEAQAVEAADSMAYNAHDLDDAVKLGLIRLEACLDVPLVKTCHDRVVDRFGALEGKMLRRTLVRELIDYQVMDVLRTSEAAIATAGLEAPQDAYFSETCIGTGTRLAAQKCELEQFLFQQVYRHPQLTRVRSRSQTRLLKMFEHYCQRTERLPAKFQQRIDHVGKHRAVGDYLAGMTDHYCLQQYEEHVSADDLA